MIRRFRIIYTITLLFSGCCFFAYADEHTNTTEQIDSLMVGSAIQIAPRYIGSHDTKISVLPTFQAHQGIFFADSVKGIGYHLQKSSGFYVEHTLGYDLGRADKDSDWQDGSNKLKGLGSIKTTVNTSLTLGYQITDWFATEAMMTVPLNESQGMRYQTSLKGGLWQDRRNTIAFEIDALFGSNTYINRFYGVNANQSRNSQLGEYHASGGIYAQSLYIDWTHKFTDRWSTDWNIGYTYLYNKAASSPIVNKRYGIESAFVVMYFFEN